MMYNYLKLSDDTQIACSQLLDDNTIQVSIERPVVGGFDSAICFLPLCEWRDSIGFSETELNELAEIVKNNAPLIYRFSKEAGKTCA